MGYKGLNDYAVQESVAPYIKAASAGNTQVPDKSIDDAVFDKLLSQGTGLDKLM